MVLGTRIGYSPFHDRIRQESVPTHIIAGLFNFTQSDFFETTSAKERDVLEVDFNT